jgi:hypothetical protein
MEVTSFGKVLDNKVIDKALGIIKGVSLISTPEAKGHNLKIDEKSIESFYNALEGKPVKAYYTHSPSNDALSSIGLWENFEIVQEENFTKLTGTFKALDSWKKHHADEFDAFFELAEKAPEELGVSAEFVGTKVIYKDGEELEYVDQENAEVFARATEVQAFSIVAEPSANPTGLFSKKDSEELASQLQELSKEKTELALDLDVASQTIESLTKELKEIKVELKQAFEELKDSKEESEKQKTEFNKTIADMGSEPVEAIETQKNLTFEEKLANCKTWLEKKTLIDENINNLVETWGK